MTKFKKSIFFLLFVLVFFTSCNGQTTTKQSNETVAEQLSFTSKHTKLSKTQGSNEYQQIGCSLRDKSGNIWFGTTGEGVYRYDGKVFTQFTKKDGLCGMGIFFILEDISGDIWLGTKEAISRFDGKKFTNISIPGSVGSSSLPDNSFHNTPSTKNELWSMMQDRSGKIWLGTTDGIYCFDGKTFTRFLNNKNILNTNNVSLKWTQCIFEDKAGNIWFGSWVLANEGICCYDGKSITQYKPYGEGWVRSIMEDKNGTLLIVTRHTGVCSFDGKNFTNLTQKGGIQNGSINVAFEDKAGNLWFGTELGSGELNEPGGLWRYDGKSFTRFTRQDGLCHNGVYSIVEDTAGNLWIGSRNTDLCRYNGKTFTRFSE
ncbi:MAG: two-component regulator propeller domain-containing protein [Bacteroidota bacterium]